MLLLCIFTVNTMYHCDIIHYAQYTIIEGSGARTAMSATVTGKGQPRISQSKG